MLSIGKLYLQETHNQRRLCADVSLDGRGVTLWFGVDRAQGHYLCSERSDAFVMALLPAAMRGGHDIVCQTPVSQRLKYQLEYYLIPTLSDAGDLYRPIHIHGPLAGDPVVNLGATGLGFSGGVDCMYSLMLHDKESAYPVTHLAVFNLGVFEGETARASFHSACENTARFAREHTLELVALDSNISQVLPERFLDVYSFRNLAGAMALQGLFARYLLSSGHDSANFSLDLRNTATYDLLTVHCAQTESLSVYLSGTQTRRADKLIAMADWESARNWLHPCFHTGIGKQNCGRCQKCTRDLITLYGVGKLEHFGNVFDIVAFRLELPIRLGFMLANRENHLNEEAIRLLEDRGVSIPKAAYVYANQFEKAKNRIPKE